jgi:hypothetical protein
MRFLRSRSTKLFSNHGPDAALPFATVSLMGFTKTSRTGISGWLFFEFAALEAGIHKMTVVALRSYCLKPAGEP